MASAFPTPFNFNRIQGIPGPKGDPGATGAAGVGNGLDVTAAPYGADHTGAADCTAAFADASADASASAAQTIYVPVGTYKLSSTQTISGAMKFAPGAKLKPASGQTVTLSGEIQAGDYQQLFDTSLGGVVKVSSATKISACWFGADPSGTPGTVAAAIDAALDTADTGIATGDGNMRRAVFLPTGNYALEKPIVITAGNLNFAGQDLAATSIGGNYCGPAILASLNGTFPVHGSDYAGLNSVSFEDGSYAALRQYGNAWELNGKSAFSMDFIVEVNATQVQSCVILSSSGTGPSNLSNSSCFQLWTLAADAGGSYTNTNLGLKFVLKTSSGSVTAQTSGPVITTSSGFHHIRIDYDGSAMRIFLDGVAQTLITSGTSIAQTGTLKQDPFEGVILGTGSFSNGFAGSETVFSVPNGFRLASMRLKYVSQGSSNYTPPTGKYAEDSDTKFLANFDVLDSRGGLFFARCWSIAGLLLNAWIPNIKDTTQFGNLIVEKLYIGHGNGPGIESCCTPQSIWRDLFIRAQSGVILNQNCYFNEIKQLRSTCASSGWGIGIKLGGASNFTALANIVTQGFTVNLYSECIFSASGGNYWVTAQWVTCFLEGCFIAEMTGSNFISDEGTSFHQTMGMVLKGVASGKFSGFLFGLQSFSDQWQVVINNSQRPISADGFSHIGFDHSTFSVSNSVPHIWIETSEAGDTVDINNCDHGNAENMVYGFDTDGAATIRWLTVGPAWQSSTKGLWGPIGAQIEADLPASTTTTNDTPVTIFTFAMADLTDLRIDVIVKAKDLTDTSKGASWNLSADYRRNGGAPALDGSLTKVANGSNAGAPPTGVDCTITTSGNNVIVQATGDSSDHYKWVCVPQEITVT